MCRGSGAEPCWPLLASRVISVGGSSGRPPVAWDRTKPDVPPQQTRRTMLRQCTACVKPDSPGPPPAPPWQVHPTHTRACIAAPSGPAPLCASHAARKERKQRDVVGCCWACWIRLASGWWWWVYSWGAPPSNRIATLPSSRIQSAHPTEHASSQHPVHARSRFRGSGVCAARFRRL